MLLYSHRVPGRKCRLLAERGVDQVARLDVGVRRRAQVAAVVVTIES